MITLKRILMIVAVVVPLLMASNAYAEREYIETLDITVVEHGDGAVVILAIGRHSPFRRYSWFRVGDVIETVDGVKTTVYVLNSLRESQDPLIKFRRGVDLSTERQIGLERSIYGLPPYLNRE